MSPRACPRTLVPLVLIAAWGMACQRPAERSFRYSSDAASRSGLVALADGVVLGNEAGAVVRLGRDGQPVWRVGLGREVAARPTVSGDGIVAGTVAGELVSLTLAEGKERWRQSGQPPVLTALASDASSVYVVAPDGAVRAHALDSGQVRWRRPGPRPEEAHLDASRPLPAPVLAGGVLGVALGDAGLVALSTADGAVRWRQPVGQVLGLEVADGVLYASTRTGRVLALGLADGVKRWESAPAPGLTSPPTLALGRLWVGAAEAEKATLLGLSPGDGTVTAREVLPAPLSARPAVFGPWLLVPTDDRQGRLLALPGGQGEPAFTLRLDTPLRTQPLVLEDQLFVLGQDGRVLSWRLRQPER
ncbi:PQQ-binding-like beta-propeller repeat protein [Myxococcaceae bacterium GXIMD 01537]